MSEQHCSEVWKAVDGSEGFEVSNLGRVRSQWTQKGCQKRGWMLSATWRIVRSKPGKNGYVRVWLRTVKGGKRVSVHRLVLETFFGPCPEGMEGCHGPDTNKTNNRMENLRWDTHHGNIQDSVKQGTRSKGTNRACHRLTEDDVRAIRTLSEEMTSVALGKQFGVSKTTIRNILIGRAWKHVA